jgi:hypothetical protein
MTKQEAEALYKDYENTERSNAEQIYAEYELNQAGSSPEQVAEQGNDQLASEFQIPGGFDQENEQAMIQEFGNSPADRAAQDFNRPEVAEKRAFDEQQADFQRRQQERKTAFDENQKVYGKRDALTQLTDLPSGVNAEIMSLIGIPGTLWDGAVDLAGVGDYVGKSGASGADMRSYGAMAGINYEDKNAPKTALYKTGEFLTQGAAFLFPFLRMGKAGEAAALGGEAAAMSKITAAKGGGVTTKPASTTELVSREIARPFQANAGQAWAAEGLMALGTGYGSHYGEREGEAYKEAGALTGGIGGQSLSGLGQFASNTVKKQIFSMSEAGSKLKTQDYFEKTKTFSDTKERMNKAKIETLPNVEISNAKLTGDNRLMQVERELAKHNPLVEEKLKQMHDRTNMRARDEMDKLGGKVQIEETQAYLQGRTERIELVMNERMKLAASRAQEAIDPLTNQKGTAETNKAIDSEIGAALKVAKDIEQDAWGQVSKTAKVFTLNGQEAYSKIVADSNKYKSNSLDDIPQFVRDAFGTVSRSGKVTPGYYGKTESVLELKNFRSKLSDQILKSESQNEKRFLTDLRDGIFRDMETAQGTGVNEAIAATKSRHDLFEGDIMNKVFSRDKYGKKLDETLTVDSLTVSSPQGGVKAAASIKKVLAAAPNTYGQLESLVKIRMANSSIIREVDGMPRVNMKAAKKFLNTHEEVLNIFPETKKQLEFAIGQEQRFIGTKGAAEARIKKIQSSSAYKLGNDLPGQVLPTIMKAKYPQQEMKKILQQSNKTGRRGIRRDIVEDLLKSSETSRGDEQGNLFLSGQKLLQEWNKNKKVYSQAFNKYEMKRLERIMKTLTKNEGLLDKTKTIDEVLPQTNVITRLGLSLVGLNIGHRFGKVTGSNLAATSFVMKHTNNFIGWLDGAKSKRLIVDAVDDFDLYQAITTAPVQMTKKHINKLKAWQAVVAVDSYEEDQ